MKKNTFIKGMFFTAAVVGAAYLAYKIYRNHEQKKAEDAAFEEDIDDVCKSCKAADCSDCKAFDKEAEEDGEATDCNCECVCTESECVENTAIVKIKQTAKKVSKAVKGIEEVISELAENAIKEIKNMASGYKMTVKAVDIEPAVSPAATPDSENAPINTEQVPAKETETEENTDKADSEEDTDKADTVENTDKTDSE